MSKETKCFRIHMFVYIVDLTYYEKFLDFCYAAFIFFRFNLIVVFIQVCSKKIYCLLMYGMLSNYAIFSFDLCFLEDKKYSEITKQIRCFLTFVSKCMYICRYGPEVMIDSLFSTASSFCTT